MPEGLFNYKTLQVQLWGHTDVEVVFVVRPRPERVEQLTEVAKSMLVARHCPKSSAASLRGTLIHLAGASAGKTGRSNHFNLGSYADGFL